jgi:hypothetical protein
MEISTTVPEDVVKGFNTLSDEDKVKFLNLVGVNTNFLSIINKYDKCVIVGASVKTEEVSSIIWDYLNCTDTDVLVYTDILKHSAVSRLFQQPKK